MVFKEYQNQTQPYIVAHNRMKIRSWSNAYIPRPLASNKKMRPRRANAGFYWAHP
jgi:hypothetical protein